jgi:SAM-dependent methyltransferase
MQYEPIKRALGRFFSGPLFMRKFLYLFLDILLLRAWHIRKALRKMTMELPVNADVLDAGSGLGQYTWRMCRMNSKWKITGVDISSEEIKDCQDFFRKAGLSQRVDFRTADLVTYDSPDTFDLILSVDVMEHIRDDDLVFRNFHNSLRAGGLLLISTPSDQGGSDVHSDNERSFIEEHVRNGYAVDEISAKLAAAGFTNINVSFTYGRPGNMSWHLVMKYPVKMLSESWLFIIVLPFYYLIFFPVSIILNIFDLRLTHKKGTGLLVTAVKAK